MGPYCVRKVFVLLLGACKGPYRVRKVLVRLLGACSQGCAV